jgi:hypothetical protein
MKRSTPEDRTVDEDVLASGELGMEPGPHLEQGGRPTPYGDPSLRRAGDSGEELQEGALARTVGPDQTEDLAAFDLERDIPQRPELTAARVLGLQMRRSVPRPACTERNEEGVLQPLGDQVPAARHGRAEPVALANPLHADRRSPHSGT